MSQNWTQEDAKLATSKGWDLMYYGQEVGWLIQRTNIAAEMNWNSEKQEFNDDCETILNVVRGWWSGCTVCAKALTLAKFEV